MSQKNKKKKRIAIFHCGFIYTGGGERIVIEEMNGLCKKGYEVDCFVPIYDPALSYPDIIKSLKIKTFLPQLPSFVPFRFGLAMVISCILSPLYAFRFVGYDLILGANQPGAFIAWVVAGILRKPYFVYLNQPNRILYPRDHENWQNVKDYYYLNLIINKIFRLPISILDKNSIIGGKNLFINGKFIAREIIKTYKPKKWTDCPAGASKTSETILTIDRFKGSVRVNGKTSIEKPYILLTSRHEPWKKFDWAIEVVNEVLSKYPGTRLVIPGAETAFTPSLKNLTMELGIEENVIFTGPIDQKDLQKLYQNSAVYLFTSPKEDLGIVVLEAQASGTPVVAWDKGGPTVTVVNNKTGYLVKPYKFSDMAKKVIKLLKDKKQRGKMGKNAFEHIKNNFSWERHIDIMDKEFKKHLN